MKHLKNYKSFNEDATANASTAGMGGVSPAQPGVLPGTTGVSGSGDVTFTFKRIKEVRKKGDVTEVSDLRDLKPANINKVDQ